MFAAPATAGAASTIRHRFSQHHFRPNLSRGRLIIQSVGVADTFFDMLGFTKGYVWVNGFNLGRFWETRGPQHTLYVPAPFLKMGSNEIIVLDLHNSDVSTLESVVAPRYDKRPVPHTDFTWIWKLAGICTVLVVCLVSFRFYWRRKDRTRLFDNPAASDLELELATEDSDT